MNYVDIVLIVIAWFIFIAILFLISRIRGFSEKIKIYYGLALVIKGRENVERFLRFLEKPLERISGKVISIVLSLVFIVTMLFLIPVPILLFPVPPESRLVVLKYFLYSPVVVILRNVILIIASSIHHISPMQMINLGFMSLQPIIPGVTVSLYTFLLIIITAGISILVHEIAHGIVSLRYRVPIVSGGFFTSLFILMGGFVEPEEEKLKILDIDKKIAIYSAGVVANILLALFTLLLYFISMYLTDILGYPLGVVVLDSKIQALPANSIILALNGYHIYNIYDVVSVLLNTFNKCLLTHTLTLKILIPGSGVKVVNIHVQSCEISRLVKYISFNLLKNDYFTLSNTLFYRFLFWLFNLNITLALLNALPAYPVDGGQVLNAFLTELIENEKIRQIILYVISTAFWGGLIITIVYTFKSGLYVIG